MPAGVRQPEQGETAGAATPRWTMVERSPSRSGPLARARTRLARGALNAAPERYDVTLRGGPSGRTSGSEHEEAT
ncbi:hypothetical protein MRX96_057137 [Rhipicephalus microplus]